MYFNSRIIRFRSVRVINITERKIARRARRRSHNRRNECIILKRLLLLRYFGVPPYLIFLTSLNFYFYYVLILVREMMFTLCTVKILTYNIEHSCTTVSM